MVQRRHDPTTFVRYRKALELADAHRSPLKRVLFELERTVAGGRDRGARRPERGPAAGGVPRAAGAGGGGDLGPAGTGKTRLLAKVLAELVREGDRPWALADSNAAVDHLALRRWPKGSTWSRARAR